MAKADLFASGERKWENNDQVRAATEDVIAVHRRGIGGIKFELETGYIDDGETIREMRADDRKGREGRLANAHTHRYEVLDDDSVLEIILHGDSLEPEFVSHPNLVTSPKGLIAGGPGPTTPADDNGG